MDLSLNRLADRIEGLGLKDPNRRDLNTKVLMSIDGWLREEGPDDWVGFTHVGLRRGEKDPSRWNRLEVLLDALVFERGELKRPIFGAEMEWSRRRRRGTETPSTSFLKGTGLAEVMSGDQATKDRAYDLLKLAFVRPKRMAFFAREDH